MKTLTLVISIMLLTFAQPALAECVNTFAYGQIKQDCSHSNGSSGVEYTEIPYNANRQISKHKNSKETIASLEQSVNKAQTTQSPFEPTHTQLDQVKQLLDYAKSQGCTWGGKFDEPILTCP